MSEVSGVARFSPEGPGKGKFVIVGFVKQLKDFGNYNTDGIYICVTKESRELVDWRRLYKDKDKYNWHEGFIKIDNVKGEKSLHNFSFEVDNRIVDPMAWDSKGMYILKLKGISGTIYQFPVDTKDMPIASSARYSKVETPDNSFVNKTVNIEPKSTESTVSSNLNSTNANKDSSKANIGMPENLGSNIPGGVISGANSFGATPDSVLGTQDLKSNPSYDSLQPNSASSASANIPSTGANNNKSIFIMKIVGIVCVILLLIGALLFVMNLMKGNASAPIEESQSNINQACSLENAKGDDKAIINNCLQSNPTVDDLNYLLANAMKQDRCEIVLRILRTKGRTSDGSIYAYVYSQYADPNSSYKSKCINKSQDDVIYWSERVKSNQSFNQAQADELLKSLK